MPRARRNAKPDRVARTIKASSATDCHALEQLPNIGPSLAADLRDLGVLHPGELATRDPLDLYQRLGTLRGHRQDPCVLDTFIAIVDFMQGGARAPWWSYTAVRKERYGLV